MFSSEISHKSSAETLPRPRDMLESESNIFNLLQKIDELGAGSLSSNNTDCNVNQSNIKRCVNGKEKYLLFLRKNICCQDGRGKH